MREELPQPLVHYHPPSCLLRRMSVPLPPARVDYHLVVYLLFKWRTDAGCPWWRKPSGVDPVRPKWFLWLGHQFGAGGVYGRCKLVHLC